MQDKYRVCWVTNMPAPYRLPIFDELAKNFTLEVIFTLGENNWRGWQISNETSWKSRFLNLKYALYKDFEFIPGVINPFRVIGRPDLIVLGSWETPLYFLILFYGRLRKIPVFAIYYSHEKSQKFRRGPIDFFRKIFFRQCAKIFTFGNLSNLTLARKGIDKSRIISLYNSVNGYEYAEYALANRSESKKGHRFIYVGQLIERKNVKNLVLAFDSINQIDDTLEIVGEGDQLPKLLDLVSQIKSQNKIKFTGYVPPELIKSVYSRNDTLILASTREVWGLVVNEALASGLHVVVSENCGVINLVNSMNGVYICNEDIDSIREAMIKSKSEFSGHITSPEILKFSTNHLAVEISESIYKHLSVSKK